MFWSIAALSYLFIGAVFASDFPAAKVFLHKTTATDPIVEGQNFEVSYHLYNGGDITATKVAFTDRYDPQSFTIVGESMEDGSVFYELGSLAPGAEVTVNLTVVPLQHGVYESTRARLQYYSEEVEEGFEPSDESMRLGFSSTLGRVKILSPEEYSRISTYYIKEVSVILGAVAISTILPFVLWMKSNAALDKLSKKRV